MPKPLLAPLSLDKLENVKKLACQPTPVWRAELQLKTITPIFGGGVKAKEPDEIDIIRTPSIRGQLRWWWRLLHEQHGEEPQDLFDRESQLWGGVGVEGLPGKQTARRSRIQLRVELGETGRSVAAGEHKKRQEGPGLSPRPDWDPIYRNLGYGLFPLMRSKAELDATAASQLKTLPVRDSTQFSLHITLHGRKLNQAPTQEEISEVTHTLWAWIHLGGLGGRTRRGFGALETTKSTFFLSSEQPIITPQPFANASFTEAIAQLHRHAMAEGRVPRRWPPTCYLAPSMTLLPRRPIHQGNRSLRQSPTRANTLTTVGEAHGKLLLALEEFRQGARTGRSPGSGNKPGRSHWPEPNMLRLKFDPYADWGRHSPPEEDFERAEDYGAPRAELGLPLLIKFKDAFGEKADATLLPAGGQNRYASPLLLRPVRSTKGVQSYQSLVFILNNPDRPEKVRFKFKSGKEETALIHASTGSRKVIKEHLQQTNGSALNAFASWLVKEKKFSKVDLNDLEGANHG